MACLEIAVFAFVTCVTPGPVNMMAIISGARTGLKPNLPFVLGATLGLSCVIIASGFGISQILRTNQNLANIVTLIGSLYILYLAFLMFSRRIEIDSSSGTLQTTSFSQGAILQLINPKAWLVSMSGLAMYLQVGEPSSLILYVLMFFVACFVSVFLWVCLGSLVSAKLKTAHLTIFTRIMATLLSILVLYNLFDTFSQYLN
jgi:threonine/homoserine/homoserine lactone efflux protein